MSLISRQYNYVAGRTIKASEVNRNENTLYDLINGNIENENIKNNTLTERVLTDDINPLVRDAEKYLSFVSSGLSTADVSSSGIAKVSVTEGTIYTTHNNKMYRKNTSSETYNLTNTTNGTFYLHVSYQGTFTDTDSAIPTEGNQVIAKLVVTGQSSAPVITVTDLRRTRLYDLATHYLHGTTLNYVSATAFSVDPGTVEISNAFFTCTGNSGNIDITSSGSYFELDGSGTGGITGNSEWCYVYLTQAGTSLQWSVKLSNNPPQYADSNANTAGTLYYRKLTDKYYRCVGAIYRDASGNILKFYQQNNYIQYDVHQTIAESTTANANIPSISIRGNFKLYINGADGIPVEHELKIRPTGSTGDYITLITSNTTSSEYNTNTLVTSCFTNSSQQIDLFVTDDVSGTLTCKTIGYWMNIRS